MVQGVNTKSDVARIKQQIANEYLAAKLGLQGLNTGTSRHQWMTARQERIGEMHQELQTLVGEHDAIQIVAETLSQLPDRPTRQDVLILMQQECGLNEASTELVRQLVQVWKTYDLLVERFGIEVTRKMVEAPTLPGTRERMPS